MRGHAIWAIAATCVGFASMASVASAGGGMAPAKDPAPGDGSAGSDANDANGSGSASTDTTTAPRTDLASVLDHRHQFGLSARLDVGLRGIATYHPADYCGATDSTSTTGDARVCLARAPVSLELELAYGLSRKFDALVEFRVGLEQDFAGGATPASPQGPHTILLSPGARYFFGEGKNSKLFTTAQVAFDFSDYQEVVGGKLSADVGIRNLNGLWFDVNRAFGFYIYGGETLSFARWLDLELEIGIGLQGRLPM